MGASAVGCVILALLLGRVVFGMRGSYFAIGTLGIALAARELAGTWLWIGCGSGIAMPVYPGMPHEKSVVFYVFLFIQIGRAHVRTPVTNAQLVCRLLPDKKKTSP